jgi:hypothetical protein
MNTALLKWHYDQRRNRVDDALYKLHKELIIYQERINELESLQYQRIEGQQDFIHRYLSYTEGEQSS